MGHTTARDLRVKSGENTNILVEATWDPALGGAGGPQMGKDLISQYLSGFRVTLAAKAHRDSFPSSPLLSDALSKITLSVEAPKLRLPGEENEEDTGHFIRDATFHIFSSTAAFTLVSPLQHNILYITDVNATAFYNHTEPVGHIKYDLPFAVTPGANPTPKLPVQWNMSSVGYDSIRKALGQNLRLDAFAIVGIRVGEWLETVWYIGRGIGAHIRI